MGLFDKKYCDICNEKIGLLGNRKLEDGNLCKNCAKKLSPWFDDRRKSTINQIEDQLKYREENQTKLTSFRPTREYGSNYVIRIDENNKKFVVTKTNDIIRENPDVIDFSQITGCELDIEESRSEDKQKNSEGNYVSYNPPRYTYSYDFNIEIRVNHPFIDKIKFNLCESSIRIMNTQTNQNFTRSTMGNYMDPRNNYEYQTNQNFARSTMGNYMDPRNDYEYQKYEKMGEEIRAILLKVDNTPTYSGSSSYVQANEPSSFTPAKTVICPWCTANVELNLDGICKSCGGSVI